VAASRLRWPAERIAEVREQRLREIIAWSIERSPFHRRRLGAIDVDRFTEADLAGLPIMTKRDMMHDFDHVVTNPALTLETINAYLEDGPGETFLLDQYRVIVTGGSSGTRGLFVYGWEEWLEFAHLASRWESRGRAEVPAGAPMTSLFSTNPLHVSGALNAFFDSVSSGKGRSAITYLPVTMPIPEIVKRLNEAPPVVLQGYPSAVRLLALEAEAGRLHICPVEVSTCGEQLTEETRRVVREVWGAEIYDIWGCSEGVYAFPCEAARGMHLPDDLAIVEPVDLDGNIVAPGVQADKILVTSLYNKTQPLIRYEVTDSLRVLQEPCECGCAHRRIDALAGRTDGFFFYEGGIALHCLGMVEALTGADGVAEFQVTQTPHGADVIVVPRDASDLEAVRLRIVGMMKQAGLEDPRVNLTRATTVDRLWSGKTKQFKPLV
jgi:phenylacetate-coenzyme A ligase PaaK-like adenylate-forming protein